MKASNPESKFRLLSTTLSALSPSEPDSDLKTFKRKKNRFKCRQKVPIFDISRKKNFTFVPHKVFVAGNICLGSLSPISNDNNKKYGVFGKECLHGQVEKVVNNKVEKPSPIF